MKYIETDGEARQRGREQGVRTNTDLLFYTGESGGRPRVRPARWDHAETRRVASVKRRAQLCE